MSIKISVFASILFAMISCKQTHWFSNPKVSNSIQDNDQTFEEVVMLYLKESETTKKNCSGVFVTPRVLITAAHCVYTASGDLIDEAVYIDEAKIRHVGATKPWDSYVPLDNMNQTTRFDLAIVEFDAPVAPKVASISRVQVKPKDFIVVAGFGHTDPSKPRDGKRYYGSNTVKGVDNDVISVLEPHETKRKGIGSIGLGGDSGGGVFNSKGELIGIAAAVTENPKTMQRGGAYVDINGSGPKGFFGRTVEDLCLQRKSCFSCFGFRLSAVTKWISKLSQAGEDTLNSAASPVVRGGLPLANRADTFALNYIDKLLGQSKNINIKAEHLQDFDLNDAFDHYFHKLAELNFLKNLESGGMNPEDYIINTYRSSMEGLSKEGRCGGSNCSLIYKFPENKEPKVYLDRLKNGPFQDTRLSENLPRSLKKKLVTNPLEGKHLDEMFQCLL